MSFFQFLLQALGFSSKKEQKTAEIKQIIDEIEPVFPVKKTFPVKPKTATKKPAAKKSKPKTPVKKTVSKKKAK